jgi:undecaprenyl-diphosphatase
MFKNLLDQILAKDIELFQLLNSSWSHPVLDNIMPIFTDLHLYPLILYPFVSILFAIIFYYHRKKGVWILSCVFISIALADGISYRLIKPAVQRLRPPDSQIRVTLRTDRFHGNSFPSNHAANAFAFATALSLFIRRGKFIYFFLAVLVSYSRVYVGVHFPLDVVCGATIGYFSALLTYKAFSALQKRFAFLI